MSRKKLLGLCILGAALVAFPAVGETPDGETPAEETICSLEVGPAFGLCNAYCEAMDCHLANDDDPSTEPNASGRACANVARNFMRVTQGRDLPCEKQVACPCFDPANWFTQDDQEAAVTWKEVADELFEPNATTCTDTGDLTKVLEVLDEDAIRGAGVDALVPECQVFVGDLEPVATLMISPDDAGSCRQLLLEAAAAQLVPCGP